jgi:alpha-tubulin suppressor-like RCC1 family protein
LGIGDNGGTDVLTPPSTDIPGLTNVFDLALGLSHTCAVLSSGGVRCWGNSVYGQLGDGQTTTRVLVPPTSDVLGGATAIAAGLNHTCAILSTGSLHCWGKALGNGTTVDRSDTNFEVLTGVRSVAAGVDFTCAVVGPGDVRCWGSNDNGQLGDGTIVAKTVPTAVPSFCP